LLAIAASLLSPGWATDPSHAGEVVRWNLSTPPGSEASRAGIEALTRFVQSESNGGFVISAYYGKLAPLDRNLDGIRVGAFEMATICSARHPDKTPVLTALDLPFLPIPNLDIQQRVHERFYGHPEVQNELDRWNAKALLSDLAPQREFIGIGDPPNSIEAWKGLTVALPNAVLGFVVQKFGERTVDTTAQNLGAKVPDIAVPEVYRMISRGVVNAIPVIPSPTSYPPSVTLSTRWYTDGLSAGTDHCALIVNAQAFRRLPLAYKELLERAVQVAYTEMKSAILGTRAKWLDLMSDRAKKITYRPEELERFRESFGRPIWQSWVDGMAQRKIPGDMLLKYILASAKEGRS
jgi:TRAP-type C4-dicarboxylate transport system substrate-binding protein